MTTTAASGTVLIGPDGVAARSTSTCSVAFKEHNAELVDHVCPYFLTPTIVLQTVEHKHDKMSEGLPPKALKVDRRLREARNRLLRSRQK